MKRSQSPSRKKESSSEDALNSEDLELPNPMEEEIEEAVPMTREGYVHDDFVVDDVESEHSLEESSEDPEEERRRREEERQRREEERKRRHEQREADERTKKRKEKKRQLVMQGNSEDEPIGVDPVVEDDVEPLQENEEMLNQYLLALEPQDIKDINNERRTQELMRADCPERLFLRKSVLNRNNSEINVLVNDEAWNKELDQEVFWLHSKIYARCDFRLNDLEGFVRQVLRLIYQENHEVMYIFTYDRDIIYPYISRDTAAIRDENVLDLLWTIWRLDGEYFNFCINRKTTLIYLDRIPENERLTYQVKLESCLDDLDITLITDEFSLFFQSNEFDPLARVSSNRKKYATLVASGLDEMLDAFGIPPRDLAQNIRQQTQLVTPRPAYENPEQIAQRLVGPNHPSVRDVINHAKMLYATQLAHVYEFKRAILEAARMFGHISTTPTQRGIDEVDFFHPYAAFKRLDKKPVSAFRNSASALRLFEAEKERFVTIEFGLQDRVLDGIFRVFVTPDDLPAWEQLKRETIRFAMKHYGMPFLVGAISGELRRHAVDVVIDEAQKVLRERVDVQPHQILRPRCSVLELSPLANKTVGGIVFGKDSFMAVVVNAESGEFLDYHFFDSFVFRFPRYEDDLTTFFRRHSTILIGVEANSPKSIFIYNKLKTVETGPMRDVFADVVFVNKDLGRIYRSEAGDEKEKLQFAGASLCRQLIDPTAEFIHIASSKTTLFGVKLHPMQTALSDLEQELFYNTMCEVFMTVVNQMGVDVNKCIDYDHYEPMLYFVCGFGEQRAKFFIKQFHDNEFHVRTRMLLTKLFKQDNLTSISQNACGFLKVTLEYSNKNTFLDQTRIHPSKYSIARQIVFDAADVQVSLDETVFNDTVRRVRKEQYAALDFDSFALELKKQQNMGDLRITLDCIVDELLDPFRDRRRRFAFLTNEDVFECVTNVPADSFHRNQIIEFTLKPNAKGKGTLSENLEVNVLRGLASIESEVGKPVSGKVLEIDLQRCVILVSCDERDLSDTGHIAAAYDLLREKERYLVVTNEELNQRMAEETEVRDYSKVIDQHFQVTTYSRAVSDVMNQSVGSWVVIPVEEDGVCKGKLLLIWRWNPDVIVKIELAEQGFLERYLGKLTMKGMTYDDLGDIESHYISPINSYLDKLRNHRKYHNDDATVDDDLRKLKLQQPQTLHYALVISKNRLGKLRLVFIPGTRTVQSFFVSVESGGFYWKKQRFTEVEDLINRFKDEVAKLHR